MQKSTGKEIQPLGSVQKSEPPASQETSESLPKNVSLQLYGLMKKITEGEISPAKVNAACNCASAIHKFLKLNQELKKQGM